MFLINKNNNRFDGDVFLDRFESINNVKILFFLMTNY
jgi:hypothetical protein